MGASQGPADLLPLHEPAADNLIDGRFDERRADRFPLPSSFAKVRDEFAIVAYIGLKLGNARGNLFRCCAMRLNQTQVHCQVAQPLERLLGVAVPQQMVDTLQPLRYIGSGLWPLSLQRLGLLLQNRQPHRDVEPVDQMLAERRSEE